MRKHDDVENNKTYDMTPEQKIASVIIVDGNDTILPMLNEGDWQKTGAIQNKPVLVKGSVLERQKLEHNDAVVHRNQIVGEALYSPDRILPASQEPTKNYHHFAKFIEVRGKFEAVIIDVDEKKEYFEVVH
jgi:hypothetical protein